MMLIVGLMLAIAGAAGLVFSLVYSFAEIKRATVAVSLAAAALGVILTLCSNVTIITAGHVGVPVVFGKVSSNYIPEGVSFVNPFATVHQMSIQTENYWMSHTPHEGEN
jgi:regulator of protease activity HflC (stomatin/prohibitin superfamily)